MTNAAPPVPSIQSTADTHAPPRRTRFAAGILIGALGGVVVASIAWIMFVRYMMSPGTGGTPPIAISYPLTPFAEATIPKGGHYVDIANRGREEIVISAALLVANERLLLPAPSKIALGPGESQRVEFWRQGTPSAMSNGMHVHWPVSGDTIRIEAHGFAIRYQPVEDRVP